MLRPHPTLWLIAILILATCVSGCATLSRWLPGLFPSLEPASPTQTGPAPATPAKAAPVPIVARVDGRPITLEAFSTAVERHLARFRAGGHDLPPSIEQRIRASVLRRLIDEEIVAREARKLGLAVSDAELDRELEVYRSRFRGAAAFSEYLERSQTTVAQIRADLGRALLRERVGSALVGEIDVTADEIRAYYEANRARFKQPEQIRASRIVIPVAPDARSEQARTAAKLADTVRREVAADPTRFADLARQHSAGPQAARGGELGWIVRGRMPPAWDEVAFALQPGAVSPVVRGETGFEIIAVWEHHPERTLTVEEATIRIRETLLARKRDARGREALERLLAGATVEILTDESAAGADGS